MALTIAHAKVRTRKFVEVVIHAESFSPAGKIQASIIREGKETLYFATPNRRKMLITASK